MKSSSRSETEDVWVGPVLYYVLSLGKSIYQ